MSVMMIMIIIAVVAVVFILFVNLSLWVVLSLLILDKIINPRNEFIDIIRVCNGPQDSYRTLSFEYFCRIIAVFFKVL